MKYLFVLLLVPSVTVAQDFESEATVAALAVAKKKGNCRCGVDCPCKAKKEYYWWDGFNWKKYEQQSQAPQSPVQNCKEAPAGYRWECDENSCRLVPIVQQVQYFQLPSQTYRPMMMNCSSGS